LYCSYHSFHYITFLIALQDFAEKNPGKKKYFYVFFTILDEFGEKRKTGHKKRNCLTASFASGKGILSDC